MRGEGKSDYRRCDLETAAVIFLSYCIWNIFQQIYNTDTIVVGRFRKNRHLPCSWRFCQSDCQSDRWLFVGLSSGAAVVISILWGKDKKNSRLCIQHLHFPLRRELFLL